MKKHETFASEYFNSGCNCCQSVLLPYCNELGLDLDKATKLSSSFGGGIGGLGEVCGAVCGIFMVMGLKYSDFDPTDKEAKDAHKQFLQTLAQQFKDDNGSILCRELIEDVTEENKHAHCNKYIIYAANLIDKTFEKKDK